MQTCDGCLYLIQLKDSNYCEMRNVFVQNLNQPICDKWKHKPKKKTKPEENWDWVQIEMKIDK